MSPERFLSCRGGRRSVRWTQSGQQRRPGVQVGICGRRGSWLPGGGVWTSVNRGQHQELFNFWLTSKRKGCPGEDSPAGLGTQAGSLICGDRAEVHADILMDRLFSSVSLPEPESFRKADRGRCGLLMTNGGCVCARRPACNHVSSAIHRPRWRPVRPGSERPRSCFRLAVPEHRRSPMLPPFTGSPES